MVETLVFLRGGGLFLSSNDALKLIALLESGQTSPQIQLAIERAAEQRRAKRSRLPLTLGQAARYLGKRSQPSPPPDAPEPTTSPLQALSRALRAANCPGPLQARHALADALSALPAHDASALCLALDAVRSFREAAWQALSPAEHASLQQEARASLGDILAVVDEDTGHTLLAETTADCFVQRWPYLSAATLAAALDVEPG